MRLSCFLLLAIVCAVVWAAPPVHWNAIGANPDYRVSSTGSPFDEAGARIRVVAAARVKGGFGGAITRIDAAPFVGKQVGLSAGLATQGAAEGASVWLRVDGAAGKLGFASSQPFPVASGGAPARREVSLRVPEDADGIVFGLVLQGGGGLDATDVRFRVEDAARSGATARGVLESAVAIIRENALRPGGEDWDRLAAELMGQQGDARSPEAAHPAIRKLLAALSDGHSFLIPSSTARQAGTAGVATRPPVVKLLGGGVGYVLLPGFVGQDKGGGRAFSRRVLDAMAGIASGASRGWIVDLRGNSGGNMWPMLAALQPLLGDGSIGGIRDRQGRFRDWRQMMEPDGRRGHAPDLRGARVAILLDAETASSGEAVAVAFHGRPGTRSFGQPTFGQSTSNATFGLPDGSRIALATAVDVDRNGVAFGGSLHPDEVTGPASETGDPALDAAREWLEREATASG